MGTKVFAGVTISGLLLFGLLALLDCLFFVSFARASDGTPAYAGFREIDPAKKRFIVVGDTQSTSRWEFWRERNDRQRRLVIDEMTRREPAFVVHLGDLTTRGGSEKHWREFDEFHGTFREKKIPYFPVLGNHEFYGNDRRALDYYFSRFPHLEKRRWYGFEWKNVGFILLHAGFSNLTVEQKREQERWYLAELEKFDRDDRIGAILAFCHESPYTNNRVVGASEKSRVSFAKPFTRFRKTALFFSGHSHSYERFEIGGKSFIVSGGGGGPRHKLNIDPDQRRYRDLYSGPALRFFHFCEIEIGEGTLQVKVARLEEDETWSVVDPLTISRPVRP
jgi:predicted phosphodiesterase